MASRLGRAGHVAANGQTVQDFVAVCAYRRGPRPGIHVAPDRFRGLPDRRYGHVRTADLAAPRQYQTAAGRQRGKNSILVMAISELSLLDQFDPQPALAHLHHPDLGADRGIVAF